MTSISAIQSLPDQQNQEPSAMHSWAVVIAHTLEHAGVDSQALFHEAGVEYKQAVNPYMRVPTAKMNKLFELSVLATNNPGFGLTMVEFIHPTTFHALGYSLFASSTLEDFFERLVRFVSPVTTAYTILKRAKLNTSCVSNYSCLTCLMKHKTAGQQPLLSLSEQYIALVLTLYA